MNKQLTLAVVGGRTGAPVRAVDVLDVAPTNRDEHLRNPARLLWRQQQMQV